jgi:hypothetical protein
MKIAVGFRRSKAVEMTRTSLDRQSPGSLSHLCLWVMWTAAAAGLAACGNAYEHISVGEWQEVGQAQPPAPRETGAFIVTTNVEGDGPEVGAGDLVKAKVLVTTPYGYDVGYTITRDPKIIWVWTGRAPQVGEDQLLTDLYTFGYLGDERIRLTFIGRRPHEQFEIHLQPGAQSSTEEIPLRAIIDNPRSQLRVEGEIGGKFAVPLEWPGFYLSDPDKLMGSSSAQIEVLAVCKARLYRRTAILTQRGLVATSGDVKYGNSRKGTLGWTAIDAQCPAPDGHIRLQAGPFYYFDAKDPWLLADWSSSYLRLRAPAEHPEEWIVLQPTAQEIINQRMVPIGRQISELSLQQRTADSNCKLLKRCEDPQKTAQRKQEYEHLTTTAVRQLKQLECELEKKCADTGGQPAASK